MTQGTSGRTARRTRRSVTALMMAVGLLAVGACGSDSTDDASTSADTPTTLRLFKGNPHNLVQIGADGGVALGAYEKAGLDVQLTISKKVPQSMSAGNADIGMSSITEATGAIANGLDASIIGTCNTDWNKVLMVSPDTNATSFADLKGKTFGVTSPSSSGGYVTTKLAEQAGWTKDDYKIVSLGSLDGIVAALKNETIAGFLWSPQASVPLEASGAAKVIMGATDVLEPAPSLVIYARNDVIKKNPEAVKLFMKTYYDVVSQLKNDPSTAQSLYVDTWGDDPEQTTKVLELGLSDVSTDGKIPESLFQASVDATKFSIPNAASLTVDDFKQMYRYWGDL